MVIFHSYVSHYQRVALCQSVAWNTHGWHIISCHIGCWLWSLSTMSTAQDDISGMGEECNEDLPSYEALGIHWKDTEFTRFLMCFFGVSSSVLLSSSLKDLKGTFHHDWGKAQVAVQQQFWLNVCWEHSNWLLDDCWGYRQQSYTIFCWNMLELLLVPRFLLHIVACILIASCCLLHRCLRGVFLFLS